MFTKTVVAMLAMSLSASAANIYQVSVGSNGGLTFCPNTIVGAQVGDKVQFNFQAANHSVMQSSAAAPCQPLKGGFFSDFQPVGVGKQIPQFSINITNTNPIFISCPQTKAPSHCQAGMVMIINPQNASSIINFNNTARTSGPSTSPKGGLTGGTIINNAAGTNPSPLVGVTTTTTTKGKTTGKKTGKTGKTTGKQTGAKGAAASSSAKASAAATLATSVKAAGATPSAAAAAKKAAPKAGTAGAAKGAIKASVAASSSPCPSKAS